MRRQWFIIFFLSFCTVYGVISIYYLDKLHYYLHESSPLLVSRREKFVAAASVPASAPERPYGATANTNYHDAPSRQPKATIAYAISLSSCSSPAWLDGAAVLKQSIHKNSIRTDASASNYDYKMYAIVHPQAVNCSRPLETHLGYEVLIRDTPFNVSDISSKFLRETVVKRGCCGEKEFIKLWVYTLDHHSIAVHLDLDTIILQPMDELFDSMLSNGVESGVKLPIMKRVMLTESAQVVPSDIQAYFTRDYAMTPPGTKHVPGQGGFLVVRPSRIAFDDYIDAVLHHEFVPGRGWGKSGYGGFYGAQQIQGIVPYFYDVLHPFTAIELHPCVYNNMAQHLHGLDESADVCRTAEEECIDCWSVDPSTVRTAHFTNCPKPWKCRYPEPRANMHRLCKYFIDEWFKLRREIDGMYGNSVCDGAKDEFQNCCRQNGESGFIPLRFDR